MGILSSSLFALAALATGSLAFAQPPPERTGEQVVKQQCASCHETGQQGAPRIGDRAAWSPRMSAGLDAMVRSATAGHGKMPARGGLANTTDPELRAAITYMFNPAGPPPKPPPTAAPASNRKVVDGTEIYLGVARKAGETHQVTITLRDAVSKKAIEGAEVEVKVTNLLMGAETRKLGPMKAGDVASYAGDFRLSGKEPHVITVQVRRPGRDRSVEAKFEYQG